MYIEVLLKEGNQDPVVEYIDACEIGKEVVLLRNILSIFVWC